MPDEQLLCWDEVTLSVPPPKILKKHAVICVTCGDKIHEHYEVVVEGHTLCKPCAFGSYYTLSEGANSSL